MLLCYHIYIAHCYNTSVPAELTFDISDVYVKRFLYLSASITVDRYPIAYTECVNTRTKKVQLAFYVICVKL